MKNKTIVFFATIVGLLSGCNPTSIGGEACGFGLTGISIEVKSNTYQEIIAETYYANYYDGTFQKSFESNTTIPIFADMENSLILSDLGFTCLDDVGAFRSFLIILHLDENRTYTISGLPRSSDLNISEADIYGIGYVAGSGEGNMPTFNSDVLNIHTTDPVSTKNPVLIKMSINEDGNISFSE